MQDDTNSFFKAIENWQKKTLDNSVKIINGTIEDLFRSIVVRTPIDFDDMSHRGTTKANWQIGKGKDIKSKINARDPQGEQTIQREIRKLDKAIPRVFYIVNNEGQSKMLEFGLYSKTSQTGKTVNGFSTQAPAGMVRISLEEFGLTLKENVDKNK